MKKLSVPVLPQLAEAVRAEAERRGQTVAEFVRSAVLRKLPPAVRATIPDHPPVGWRPGRPRKPDG